MWHWLVIGVLESREKFLETSDYWTLINWTFTFRTTIVFARFRSVIVQFELVKHKFPNLTTFHVCLCSFQITQGVMQCTSGQGVCPIGVVANVLEYDIKVNEFELQSRNYVHFLTYTFRKGTNFLILPLVYGLDSTTTVPFQGWLWH